MEKKYLLLLDDEVCTVTAVPARPSGKSESRYEIYLRSKHNLRYKDPLVKNMCVINR